MKKMILPRSCMKVICCVLLLTVWINEAHAFDDEPPIRYLGIEQGLSNNQVTCIFQDHYGFIWFGTYDGLNKYNGYNFVIFRNKLEDSSSLINNRIVTINEDADNNIWIGTKEGISFYDIRKGNFSPLYFTGKHSSSRQQIVTVVNSIEREANGQMMVGTGGKGLIIFEKAATTGMSIPCIYNHKMLYDYHVQAIQTDEHKRVWVFVQGVGLCLYDDKAESVIPVNTSIQTGTCITSNRQGILWIGTELGLFEYNVGTNTVTSRYTQDKGSLSSNNVVKLCYDKESRLWIATDGGGINILDTKTRHIRHLSAGKPGEALTSASVYAIYEDKEARKWVGTLRGGVNIIDPHRKNFKNITSNAGDPNSLISNFVLSFCEEADGKLWIGTDGGGLSVWDRYLNRFTNFKHQQNVPGSLSNNFVTSITKDFQNNIWLATYGGGVNRYNSHTGYFSHYDCSSTNKNYSDRYVWVLYEDPEKNLWAGTCSGGGLYRFNRSGNRFELFDDKLTDIISVMEDKAGQLWAGNYNTLFSIDQKSKKHQAYNIGSPVRCIYEDKAGSLWIGTEGKGLLKFDRNTNDFKAYTDARGLCNNAVLNILEDSLGNLWISTFNGISKFNPASNSFVNFYQSDGLQSNQFNYNAALVTRNGEFIFGGIKGFSIFRPDKLTMGYTMPGIELTSFRIDNITAERSGHIPKEQVQYDIKQVEVPFSKATFSFEFVALEYTAPDKIVYAYYLQGWDKTWNYTGSNRTANYSHLTEGTYILRIKSTNAEGVWNTHERVLKIIVLPPWYRTWWAYVIYLSLTAAALYIYLLYKNRQAQLTYEVRLAHMETEKEKELNERKVSFFTSVSHEFRSPLTLIVNPLKEMFYGNRQHIDAGDLHVVYRNAKRLLSLVDQLLLFQKAGEHDKLRVARLNFVEICKEVYLCFTHQASKKQIDYNFICNREAIELYADREKIEIILFNIISNALKYTPEKGTVTFRLAETTEGIQVSMEDTGPGIPDGIGNKLFEKFGQVHDKRTPLKSGFGIGLFVARNFVEIHKGTISYSNKSEGGTIFQVELRKGKDHFDGDIIIEDGMNKGVLFDELLEEVDIPESVSKDPVGNEAIDALVTDIKSMLIVDDDKDTREYIAGIFNENFKLYQSDNGEEALKLVKRYSPDIIISDVMMQKMSGIELCNKLKEDVSTSHIPVVLLTATSSAELKLEGVACGADDYITKPFEKELLVARVNSILKSRNSLQKYFYNEITLQKNNFKISEEYTIFLNRCIAVVERHIGNEEFNIKMLSHEIRMSHSSLYKKVKSISGQSVNAFIRFIRLRKAAEMFINTDRNVTEVAFEVGITDIKYFRAQFFKLFGMNPSDYIKKYRKPFQKNFTIDEKAVKPV